MAEEQPTPQALQAKLAEVEERARKEREFYEEQLLMAEYREEHLHEVLGRQWDDTQEAIDDLRRTKEEVKAKEVALQQSKEDLQRTRQDLKEKKVVLQKTLVSLRRARQDVQRADEDLRKVEEEIGRMCVLYVRDTKKTVMEPTRRSPRLAERRQ